MIRFVKTSLTILKKIKAEKLLQSDTTASRPKTVSGHEPKCLDGDGFYANLTSQCKTSTGVQGPGRSALPK
jgi:hypothetical protein